LKTRRLSWNGPVQFTAVLDGQVLPSTQKQPPFPFDQSAFLHPLPKELRAPHFVHRRIGVLQDACR
jgi:hypothetical protein